jgi:hypothetical protein
VKKKVAELEGGAELDAWVVRALGGSALVDSLDALSLTRRVLIDPSTNWAYGGPIIERERIDISHLSGHESWLAKAPGATKSEIGDTPLIAAMRAFVASVYGEEVETEERS